jgi:outer membrane protein
MSILPPLIRQLGRLAVLVCLCVLAASAQQSAVRIGMVLDGPAEQNTRLLEIFEEEITVLVEGEFQVEFPAAKQLVADWTAAGIVGAVDGLLSDPDVDYSVMLGILGSNEVSRRGPLRKPVFAAIILDPEIQGVPSEMLGEPVIGEELEQFKVSGVPNLSYVTAGGYAVQEIRVFRGLVPFSRLTILYMEALSEAVPNLRSATAAILRRSDLDIDLVPVGSSIDEAVAAIPTNAEAIFVTPLWHLSSSDFDLLAAALIERRLPSFSTRGREDIEQGILAKLRRQENYIRRAPRVALNIQ